MRRAILGPLAGIAIVMAAVAVAQQRGDGFATRGAPPAIAPLATTGSELIVVPAAIGDRSQMLTVVDPRQRVISVYQIDLATGKISLKSVRNITWDLQISDMNTENPLPQQIRTLLEQK